MNCFVTLLILTFIELDECCSPDVLSGSGLVPPVANPGPVPAGVPAPAPAPVPAPAPIGALPGPIGTLSIGVLPGLIGPVFTRPFVGGALPIYRPNDLDCDFSLSQECCWGNINGNNDELEWQVVVSQVNRAKSTILFKTSDTPDPDFLVVASNKTNPTHRAVIVSCPITCSTQEGTLEFNHWTSQDPYISVCTLPIGKRVYSFCQTLKRNNPGPSFIQIPPSPNEPFQILIEANNFITVNGSVAIIDNIRYKADAADVCFYALNSQEPEVGATTPEVSEDSSEEITLPPYEGPETLEPDVRVTVTNKPINALPAPAPARVPAPAPAPAVTPKIVTAPPESPYLSFCNALLCDLTKPFNYDPTSGKVCHNYENQNTDHHFKIVTSAASNNAAGVPQPPPGQTSYLAALTTPGEVMVLKSIPFDLPTSATVRFQVYEAIDDVQAMMCTGYPDTCEFKTDLSVSSKDLVWLDRKVTFPAGNNQRLFLVAANSGHNMGSLGFGGFRFMKNGKEVCGLN